MVEWPRNSSLGCKSEQPRRLQRPDPIYPNGMGSALPGHSAQTREYPPPVKRTNNSGTMQILSLAVAASGSLCLCLVPPEVHTLSSLARAEVSWTALVERKLLRNGSEEFPHVFARLCGSLEEEEPRFASVLLRICSWDSTLIGRLGDEIELVPGEGNDDVFVCLTLKLLYPCFCLVQRRL